MSYHPANFGGVGSWPVNLSKGLKVESTLKKQVNFILFMEELVKSYL